jgi:hypothetical protein
MPRRGTPPFLTLLLLLLVRLAVVVVAGRAASRPAILTRDEGDLAAEAAGQVLRGEHPAIPAIPERQVTRPLQIAFRYRRGVTQ